MAFKKILSIVLVCGVAVPSAAYGYSKYSTAAAATKKNNVTLLNYTSSKSADKPFSFKINSLPNINALDWLSDNEILTIKETEEMKAAKKAAAENTKKMKEALKSGKDAKQVISTVSFVTGGSEYLSIYNIDTGKSKDFKNVNVGRFISVSPDKRYALYEEPKDIPTGDEWKRDLASGKLFNYSIKLLDLTTGAVSDLKTEYKNKETNYEWINNDTLLMFYPNENDKWVIQNINGTVYKSGNYKEPNANYHSWSAHALNVKISGSNVTGYITLEQWDPSVAGITLKSTYYMIDISTNTIKQIYRSESSGNYTVQNNVILASDYSKDPKPATKLCYFDKSGTKKGEYNFEGIADASACRISRDGSKVAFAQQMPLSKIITLSILDLNTGKINKVYETNSILNIWNMNLKWNSDGSGLIFNTNNTQADSTDTYMVRIQ